MVLEGGEHIGAIIGFRIVFRDIDPFADTAQRVPDGSQLGLQRLVASRGDRIDNLIEVQIGEEIRRFLSIDLRGCAGVTKEDAPEDNRPLLVNANRWLLDRAGSSTPFEARPRRSHLP